MYCSCITNNYHSLPAATNSEVSARKKDRHNSANNTSKVNSEAAVAILKKSTQEDTSPKGSLACALPWGHGWGWSTLPNGIWSGGKSANFSFHKHISLSIWVSLN